MFIESEQQELQNKRDSYLGYSKAAIMEGDFLLNKGDKLIILVGQEGCETDAANGGSFVVKCSENGKYQLDVGNKERFDPLIVAGGGDAFVLVQSLPGKAIQVATGKRHFLALLEDGSVWGWGHDENGAIGDGRTTKKTFPVNTLDQIRSRRFSSSSVS